MYNICDVEILDLCDDILEDATKREPGSWVSRIDICYYRQLSADIEIKNYKIKDSFVSLDQVKVRANKTGINFMILF